VARIMIDNAIQGMHMALHHAMSGEVIDIRPLGGDLRHASTAALYKSGRLEVMRVVLLAGKTVPEHSVAGEISIQCLEGRVELTAAGTCQVMSAGDLLCLSGGVTHALKAVEDCAVLVTILLHGA
jgi:quercetin dioxygenase-like cupin family protein